MSTPPELRDAPAAPPPAGGARSAGQRPPGGPSARLVIVLVPALFVLAIALSGAVWILARGDTARRAEAVGGAGGATAPLGAGDGATAPDPGHRRAVAPGYFSVDAKPPATIYIGDRKVGTTPLIRYPLPPGVHRVRAVTATGRSDTFTVEIEAGKEAPARALAF